MRNTPSREMNPHCSGGGTWAVNLPFLACRTCFVFLPLSRRCGCFVLVVAPYPVSTSSCAPCFRVVLRKSLCLYVVIGPQFATELYHRVFRKLPCCSRSATRSSELGRGVRASVLATRFRLAAPGALLFCSLKKGRPDFFKLDILSKSNAKGNSRIRTQNAYRAFERWDTGYYASFATYRRYEKYGK